MSLACEYWCHYHRRIERTEDEEACLTYEECMAGSAARHYRRSDPPASWVKFLRFLGIEVKP